ncbi:hypothetical protein F5H01DRAFT_119186 [Linnemannia elongata]|nr:hypothetical protein F5H01DRAFT_119186 [Linnemannia elongata]
MKKMNRTLKLHHKQQQQSQQQKQQQSSSSSSGEESKGRTTAYSKVSCSRQLLIFFSPTAGCTLPATAVFAIPKWCRVVCSTVDDTFFSPFSPFFFAVRVPCYFLFTSFLSLFLPFFLS